jgi:hypothetical protein
MTSSPEPFSLPHLLLSGLIIDRGQLSLVHRAELDRRAAQGELVKSLWWDKAGKEWTWCWRVIKGRRA